MESGNGQDLNTSQREAVMYNEGPSLVIAGAGSGKTRVLTYKVAYLIQLGLKPYNILALTFTNKAANEMKERIAAMVDPDSAKRIYMGTFHSIFAKILRAEADAAGLGRDFTIIDADDAKKMIKDIVKDLKLDDKAYKAALVAGRISKAKNALVTAEEYAGSKLSATDLTYRIPKTFEVYKEYARRLKTSNAIDFDDMLMLTARMFASHPDVLEKYQKRFQFILVDEYQDTNAAQSTIIKQLAEKHHRVCVVGDDAQSIYAFRGANIENILQFTRIYPEAKMFKLERNYRSVKSIVSAANSLIEKNMHQIRKEVFSEREEGEKVSVVETSSDREEASMVVSTIRRLKSMPGGDWNDSAVLYRTNSQSRVIEEALLQNNIPYVIYGGHSFYQRSEIKDVLAYMKLVVNISDEVSFSRVVNKPARGIGATTVAKIAECARIQDVPMFTVAENPLKFNLDVNSGTVKKLAGFTELIRSFQAHRSEMDAYALASEIVFKSGIMEALDADTKVELEGKKENVNELLNGIKQFIEDQREEGNEQVDLLDYLNTVVLLTDADTDSGSDGSRVRLMTVHAAKGLEFKNVFVVGLEENLFPGASAATDEKELEEERRLLYVAITRAMERCTLSYAKTRFRNGSLDYCNRSRFIGDIDSRYLAVKGGGSRGGFDFSRQDESFFQRRFQGKSSYAESSKPLFIKSGFKPVQKASPQTSGQAIQQPAQSSGELRTGAKIAHERFGNGVIAAVEGVGADRKITVDFEYEGRKVLLLKYAKITIIG